MDGGRLPPKRKFFANLKGRWPTGNPVSSRPGCTVLRLLWENRGLFNDLAPGGVAWPVAYRAPTSPSPPRRGSGVGSHFPTQIEVGWLRGGPRPGRATAACRTGRNTVAWRFRSGIPPGGGIRRGIGGSIPGLCEATLFDPCLAPGSLRHPTSQSRLSGGFRFPHSYIWKPPKMRSPWSPPPLQPIA